MASKEFYKLVKLAGMLSFVPIILACGPLLGFIAGDFLVKRLHFPSYALLACIAIGFLSSIIETIRIIRIARHL